MYGGSDAREKRPRNGGVRLVTAANLGPHTDLDAKLAAKFINPTRGVGLLVTGQVRNLRYILPEK
jgi:hypothetical protein